MALAVKRNASSITVVTGYNDRKLNFDRTWISFKLSLVMSSPLLHAFFIGRAAAEVISEAAEKAFTEVLSELGKFDAEQRVNVRNFVEQVNQRAETAMSQTNMSSSQPTGNASTGYAGTGGDLQATIDDLRAEIAEVRTELQRYRSTLN
jgi:hypothetical protein